MVTAIGVIELSSIAKGIELCDNMIKAATVKVLDSLPMCPGKYVIIIAGDIASVESSVAVASDKAKPYVLDSVLIPNIHEQVMHAVNGTTPQDHLEALGIVETFSVASCIRAADTAVKAAFVNLIEVRLSRGMGGKSYVTLTGTVGDVTAAVEAGAACARQEGLLVADTVIASPHEELERFIL